MYVKRVRITNYGPIEALDIEFPFDGDKPKPVVLVGPNGSGKSILLSNIVNGLLNVQTTAYPDSPEVEPGKVYKLRSSRYVMSGKDYWFTQVDFMGDCPPVRELNLLRQKRGFEAMPAEIERTEAQSLYNKLTDEQNNIFEHGIDQQAARKFLDKCCVLYFPPNRFEDPAWLNRDNLIATAQHMDLKHVEGYSDRKIINISPLRANQDWLFDVVYDFTVLEREKVNQDWSNSTFLSETQPGVIHVLTPVEIKGSTHRLCDAAIEVLRTTLFFEGELSLNIGPRQNRVISVAVDRRIHIFNIFQLSSGEVGLLNLFLSILRDYDLTGSEFTSTKEIRGIVIVDEIDLHLHTIHQHEVLPKLMAMFPKVQFIVTSHSPLFVLGLKQVLGEEDFGLYELPSGASISAEGFDEFGEAYWAFSKTHQHSEAVQSAIKDAQKSLVFVEGKTDVQYLRRAAELLGFQGLIDDFEIDAADGDKNLDHLWKVLLRIKVHVKRKSVILLYDPEHRHDDNKGNIFQRSMVEFNNHPIKKGIENLFNREMLERVYQEHPEFIDMTSEHSKIVRGNKETVPEIWTVNKNEKTNLCDWLCKNGTKDDFKHFKPTLEMLRDILVKDTTEDAS